MTSSGAASSELALDVGSVFQSGSFKEAVERGPASLKLAQLGLQSPQLVLKASDLDVVASVEDPKDVPALDVAERHR